MFVLTGGGSPVAVETDKQSGVGVNDYSGTGAGGESRSIVGHKVVTMVLVR